MLLVYLRKILLSFDLKIFWLVNPSPIGLDQVPVVYNEILKVSKTTQNFTK